MMTTVVRRTAYETGHRQGHATLEQRFRFEGESVNAAAIARVLLHAPLTGDNAVFGDRPGEEGNRTDESRSLRRFSPAPGFRFDVDLTKRSEGQFIVRFSQPDRRVPYLQGDLLWLVVDEADGTVFDEQINTDRALDIVSEPLAGRRPSLRRWLFFRMGHRQVMERATTNIARLLSSLPPNEL